MAFLIALLEAIFGHLLGQEVSARWPKLVEAIVNFAVRALPEFHRKEKSEEWLSIVADLPGPITKIVHAFDLVRGAWWISFQEYRVSNRRDWLIFEGSIQALVSVGALWIVERFRGWRGVANSQLFQVSELALLTTMVRGYSKHAEANMFAADGYAQLGNLDRAEAAKLKGESIAKEVVDHVVDLSLISAMQQQRRQNQG